MLYYLSYLVKFTILTSFFILILHFLVPKIFSNLSIYSNYYTYQLNHLIEFSLTFISRTIEIIHLIFKLLKTHKLFLFFWIFGNFGAYVGFITSFNSDWEALFIWVFDAVCLVICLYCWIFFFCGQFFRVNDYKIIPITIGFIILLYITDYF